LNSKNLRAFIIGLLIISDWCHFHSYD